MMNIDFFPTFLAMAGVDLPTDRAIDGKSLLPLMRGESDESPHEELFYVMNVAAYAIRNRDHFKYYASTTSENAFYSMMGLLHPFLFDLIDTWNMTVETAFEDVTGKIRVDMPG